MLQQNKCFIAAFISSNCTWTTPLLLVTKIMTRSNKPRSKFLRLFGQHEINSRPKTLRFMLSIRQTPFELHSIHRPFVSSLPTEGWPDWVDLWGRLHTELNSHSRSWMRTESPSPILVLTWFGLETTKGPFTHRRIHIPPHNAETKTGLISAPFLPQHTHMWMGLKPKEVLPTFHAYLAVTHPKEITPSL